MLIVAPSAGNYGATLRDCSLVLQQTNGDYPNPPSEASHRTTAKALLRSARALSALDKLPEALDALRRLAMLEEELGEKDKDSGKKWRDEVERKVRDKERKEAEKAERERRKREGDAALVLALAVRARGLLSPHQMLTANDVAATRRRLPETDSQEAPVLRLPNRCHAAAL